MSHHDDYVDRVKDAIRGRERHVLEAAGIPGECLDGEHHPCPKPGCGGVDRFRLIDNTAAFCNQCGQHNGDVIASVQWFRDLNFLDAVAFIGEVLMVPRHETPRELVSFDMGEPQIVSHGQSPWDHAEKIHHAVYAEVVKRLSLTQIHRRQLRDRGLSDDAIDRLEYRSLPSSQAIRADIGSAIHEKFGDPASKVAGLYLKNDALTLAGSAGLFIPVRNAAVKIDGFQIRPDNPRKDGKRDAKYLWFSSSRHGGGSSGSPCHASILVDDASCCRLTEGALKADVATHLSGIKTLSIQGVGNQKELSALLVSAGVKSLRFAFDKDRATNGNVAIAQYNAVEAARRLGITVCIERWAGTHKGIDDALLAGETIELIDDPDEVTAAVFADLAATGKPIPNAPLEPNGRAVVEVVPDEHLVNDAVDAAVAKDPDVYEQSGRYVEVVKSADSPSRIEPIEQHRLRDIVSRNVMFKTTRKRGDDLVEEQVSPPMFAVNAILDRRSHTGSKRMAGIAPFPVARADGSIFRGSGYDSQTNIYCDFRGEIETPDQPTRDDALKAAATLLDVVADFPFDNPCHKSSWMALVLTVLLRHQIDGPVPMWLVDANVRGSGKTLLIELVALIVLGRAAARMSQTINEEENRKRFTSLVMALETLVLLDNVDKALGGAVLDALLTSVVWTDRMLGGNRIFTGPNTLTLCATGNNVILQCDTARRVAYIRLRSPLESPEERSGFRHSNIREHVREHRAELLSAAFTIIRAYIIAGSPKAKVSPWGSFEAWDRKVRHMVVWLGMADPGESRQELNRSTDQGASALAQLLEFWPQIDPDNSGVTSGDIVAKLGSSMRHDPLGGNLAMIDDAAEFRAAIVEICPSAGGKNLSSRTIGNRLKHYQHRVIGGRCLDSRTGRGGAAVWFVQHAKPTQTFFATGFDSGIGDSGDSDDSVSGYPTRATFNSHYVIPHENTGGAETHSPESPESPQQTLMRVGDGGNVWTE